MGEIVEYVYDDLYSSERFHWNELKTDEMQEYLGVKLVGYNLDDDTFIRVEEAEQARKKKSDSFDAALDENYYRGLTHIGKSFKDWMDRSSRA